jgi:uncharacterized lipoprotein YbaY
LADYGHRRSSISSIGLALDGQPTGSFSSPIWVRERGAGGCAPPAISGDPRHAMTATRDMRSTCSYKTRHRLMRPLRRSGQIDLAGARQPPVEFALEYDGRAIVPTHTYTIRAQISVSNEVKYASTSAYPVITRDNPASGLDIVVEPIAPGAPRGGVITGTVTYLERIALPEDAQIEVSSSIRRRLT